MGAVFICIVRLGRGTDDVSHQVKLCKFPNSLPQSGMVTIHTCVQMADQNTLTGDFLVPEFFCFEGTNSPSDSGFWFGGREAHFWPDKTEDGGAGNLRNMLVVGAQGGQPLLVDSPKHQSHIWVSMHRGRFAPCP